MIAITRILMPKINIAATTAFQALYPFGREKALLCGANIFMPNISDKRYRINYRLYDDKPCIDDNFDECLECVESRVNSIGESICYNESGDSLAFSERIKSLQV
jgi:biotin synthase